MAFSAVEKAQLKAVGVDVNNQPVFFKRFVYTPWEPWGYMAPGDRTIEILRREAAATAAANPNKPKGAIFFGVNVVAFKFMKSNEIKEIVKLPPDAFEVQAKKAA